MRLPQLRPRCPRRRPRPSASCGTRLLRVVGIAALVTAVAVFEAGSWRNLRHHLFSATYPVVAAVQGERGPDDWESVLVNFGFSGPESCSLYGWHPRREPVKLYDAFLFAGETDMLTVRLNEYGDLVDAVVVLESEVSVDGRLREVAPLPLDDEVVAGWPAEKRRPVLVHHVVRAAEISNLDNSSKDYS